ncbi:MAG TPA: N-acetylglucosamine-6-phosphate deacetylase [Stellaceae bacterium]|jgi:N-acetylglucosamine-6-phosphate deacetylase
MTAFAIVADTIFDGAAVHRNAAVIVAGDTIREVTAAGSLPTEIPKVTLSPQAWLVPGFIDLQVNGGGDVLFNEAPTPAGIAVIAAAHRRFGTTALLPTLITDTRAKMRAARNAVAAAMTTEPGVLGIHFEGPFLSPARAGVHDPGLMRIPEDGDLGFFTSPFGGVTLVTVAPEILPDGWIAALVEAGVKVALGHSAATYEQTRTAVSQGLTGFTHLFNAMPPLSAREPGPVAAALEAANAWYGLIVDGAHVAPAMIRLALRGLGTPILVTDAMPPVGGKRDDFRLQQKPIEARDGRLTDGQGRLAGSLLDMASALRNCVRLIGTKLPEALHMASTAPAEAIGLGGRLGRLRSGYRADMVAIDPAAVRVLGTWVAGSGGLHP